MKKGRIVEIVLKGNAKLMYNYLIVQILTIIRMGEITTILEDLPSNLPIRLAVPHSGHWHVAIDMRGLSGTVNASVTIKEFYLLRCLL